MQPSVAIRSVEVLVQMLVYSLSTLVFFLCLCYNLVHVFSSVPVHFSATQFLRKYIFMDLCL